MNFLPLNLPNYLQRIGYHGPLEPTLATLGAIQLAHASSIPFENIDVLLGLPISLEIDSLEHKLVTQRRGGYCFETNGLLIAALRALGFSVQPLSARVRYQLNRAVTPPATHLFARVDLDGEAWLVDSGVAAGTPTAPIRLHLLNESQPTPHEPRRIVQVQEGNYPRFIHQAQYGTEWIDVYEFTGQLMPDIDRSVANWWTSTHPDSKFRRNLIIALANQDGTRFSVQNDQFIHRRGGEILESRVIGDLIELRELLKERFGLTWDGEFAFPPS